MFFYCLPFLRGWLPGQKNEGMVYAIFNLMIILLMTNKMAFSKRSFYVGHYLGIVGIIIGPWWILKFNLGLKNILVNAEGVSRGLLENIFALGPAFKALMAVPFEFEFYNIAWIMFFLFLIFSWKRWSRAFYRFFFFFDPFSPFFGARLFCFGSQRAISQGCFYAFVAGPHHFEHDVCHISSRRRGR